MYYMKLKLWTVVLLAGWVSLPLDILNQTQVLATDEPIHIAQTPSNYDQYMRLGYRETAKRNYRRALQYFQQALQLRPDDRYAKAAIRNVSIYIQTDSSLIAFVPGKPNRLRAAATRGTWGNCFLNSKYAVPLIPTDNETQTVSPHPTFFFYVPETAKPLQGLEFVLWDEQTDKTVYKKTIKSVTQGGIVSINIPTDQPSLEPEKQYTWGFSMVCDFANRDQDWYLDGKINLVTNENLSSQIEQTTQPLEQVVLYATAGLWENAVSILANLRRQNPDDSQINKYWVDLLTSVDLQAVAQEPLLSCCTPEN